MPNVLNFKKIYGTIDLHVLSPWVFSILLLVEPEMLLTSSKTAYVVLVFFLIKMPLLQGGLKY